MAIKTDKIHTTEKTLSYKFGGNYKKGTRPTLLESVEALKVVRFIENIVYRSTTHATSGSPVRNYFRIDFRDDGKVDFWVGIQTDLIFDGDPTLASNLKLNGQDLVATLSGSKFIQNAAEGFQIQGQSGFAGSLFLAGDPENGPNTVGFVAPSTIPASVLWTLPDSDGANGEILSTDGSGNLYWQAGGGGSGTVTTVNTGTGLTGGPITISGTVSMANTAVAPGTFGNSTTVGQFTVDQQGRLTAASNVAISFPTAPSVISSGTIDVSVASGVYTPVLKGLAGVSLAGKAGLYLRVLANESGFEFVELPAICEPSSDVDVFIYWTTFSNTGPMGIILNATSGVTASSTLTLGSFGTGTLEGHTEFSQPAYVAWATVWDCELGFNPAGQTFYTSKVSGAHNYNLTWGLRKYTYDGVTFTFAQDWSFPAANNVASTSYAWTP